jgi:hypothetical protein
VRGPSPSVSQDSEDPDRIHRFREVCVESSRQGPLPVFDPVVARDGDKADGVVACAEPASRLVAVDAGQANVDEDEVGARLGRGREGRLTRRARPRCPRR